MVRRRRYVRLLRITQPLVPKTRLTHAQPFQLMFETVDPHWYEDTVQTETIAVVSGAQPKVHAFTTEGGLNDTSRVFITITKDGAGNPSNVSIGDANGKTLVTVGSLTIASEKWEIDCYDGIVKRGTAAWPAGADHMEEMSGDFLTVDKAAETYTISDATPASFNVKVEFIRKLV